MAVIEIAKPSTLLHLKQHCWPIYDYLCACMHAGTVKGGVVVWFFGTFEMACLKPTEIRSFAQGLALSLHATCKRSVKLFRTALQQAHRYMEAGLLTSLVPMFA